MRIWQVKEKTLQILACIIQKSGSEMNKVKYMRIFLLIHKFVQKF